MDERRDERADEAKDPEKLEDLDVPESAREDVKGGAEPVHNYSIVNAWPKKYSG